MKIMKKLLLFALAFCLALPAMTFNAKAEDTAAISFDVTFIQSDARKELLLINNFRTGSDAWYWNSDNTTKTQCSNLSALAWDYNLEKVAMQRCVEIALSYSHTRPDNTTCWEAYTEQGYEVYSAGENIAAGYTTYQSVFEGWQETDNYYSGQGHRRNMLSSNYKYVACAGCYFNGTYYWVQEFSNSTSASTSFVDAVDGVQSVSAEIALSNLTSVTLTSAADQIEIEAGSSMALPTVTTSILLEDTWSQSGKAFAINNASQFAIANTSIASISGNTITAKKVGNTQLTISSLGKSLSIPVIVKNKQCDHDYTSKVTKEPTCTAEGVRTYTCSKCGYQYTEPIDKIAHTIITDPAVEPTCVASGKTEGTHCSVCNQVITVPKNIAALGHDYTDVIIAPTKDSYGYTLHTCKRCGDSYEDTFTYLEGSISITASKSTCYVAKDRTATVILTVKGTFEGIIVAGQDNDCFSFSFGEATENQMEVDITGISNGTGTLIIALMDEGGEVVANTCININVTDSLPFTDVPAGKWYTSYIREVYEKGLMTGTNETTFGPYNNLTRGQLATILYRMEGQPSTSYSAIFPDVKEGKYYTNAVMWAYANGIITGYKYANGTTDFKPGNNITRQELALMLYRYAKYKGVAPDSYNLSVLSMYPDKDKVSSWARTAVAWAVGNGLISGNGGYLDPQGTANRAQAAKMISVTDNIINN